MSILSILSRQHAGRANHPSPTVRRLSPARDRSGARAAKIGENRPENSPLSPGTVVAIHGVSACSRRCRNRQSAPDGSQSRPGGLESAMMTHKLLIPAVLLVTLGLTAPVSAGQARPREERQPHEGRRAGAPAAIRAESVGRGGTSRRQNQPRQNQPRQVQPRQVQPRQVQPRQVQPRQVQPRQVQPQVNGRREATRPRSNARPGAVPQRVAPRRTDQRAYAVPRTRQPLRPTRRLRQPTLYRPSYRVCARTGRTTSRGRTSASGRA